MRKSLNMLICSAGRRVELLQCFRAGAERLGIELQVIGCDLNPAESAACSLADSSVAVPRCDDPNYANAILETVQKHGIDLVVPTIDPDLMPLTLRAKDFHNLGARLHVSSPEVIEIVRDKQLTSSTLKQAGIPVPTTLSHPEILQNPGAVSWPVFAKPSAGSASRGLQVYNSPRKIPADFPEPMIFQDMLSGPEFTVNMFVDANGNLRTVIPHRRDKVRAGEVEKGETCRRSDLREIAEGIARALPGLRGVACFQVIDDPGHGPKVIEINARFGGGYPLADHAGAQFAQWLLEEVSGHPLSAHDNWRDGVSMMRYDCAVYVG